MKIAVDMRSLMETGGRISGVENYLLNLLGALQHMAARTPVEYLTFYNRYAEVPAGSLADAKRSRIPNKLLNASLKIFSYPKFEQLYGDFDVLWMPDLRPFALKAKTRLALTVHDLSPVIHPEYYSLRRRVWHHVINHAKSFRRADIIFAVSEYTKYDIVKLFDIDPRKIEVIYPGIDHKIFNPHLDQRLAHKVAEKYNLPKKYILSISTIEPRKNIIGLVNAFEKISDPEVHLVIAGRLGWLYADFMHKIKSSAKKDKIRFLEYVDERDKPYLISQARLLCYPSFYEGFGFQPLEAMACGVPVVTSARTSMPEICADAALLIEPYQLPDLVYALNQLLSDDALRANFIKKGLLRAAQFSWQDTAQKIHNRLISLL